MHTHESPPVRRPPHRSRRFPMSMALLTALLGTLLGARASATAGDCSTCPRPSILDLFAAGVSLQVRQGDFVGDAERDYVELDAGECTSAMVGNPVIVRDGSYLVLRGQGEVWDCPHSKSVDTVTITTSETDSSSWTISAKVGAKLKVLAAEVSAEISAGRTRGESITEVTSVSKQIIPGPLHRIQWMGYFEVSEYRATAEFAFTQRWAWWTKNRWTGATVHQKGDLYMHCGTSTVELTRKAPIAGYFELTQRGCGAGCAPIPTVHLGFFPELPPRLRPDDAGGEVEPGEDAPPVPDVEPETPPAPQPQPDDDDGEGDGAPPTSGDLPNPPGMEDAGPAGSPLPPLPGAGQ